MILQALVDVLVMMSYLCLLPGPQADTSFLQLVAFLLLWLIPRMDTGYTRTKRQVETPYVKVQSNYLLTLSSTLQLGDEDYPDNRVCPVHSPP